MNLCLFILLIIQSVFPVKTYKVGEVVKVSYGDSIVEYNFVDEKIEKQYTIKTPDDFDVNSYVWLDDFFVHPGGGMVYELLKSLSVNRVDKSYDHKLQLGSIVFKKNDTLYKYGGYGFFSDRNFFTYYDKKISEWETFRLNGDVIPVGVYGSSHFVNKDFFLFFGGSTVDPLDRSRFLSNRKVFQFDFSKREWRLRGEVENSYPFKKNTIQTDRGVIYFSDDTEVIDLYDNSVIVLKNNPIHRKIAGSRISPFFHDDYIYYLNSDDITELSKISYSDFMISDIVEKKPFVITYLDTESLIQTIEEGIIGVLLLIVLIFLSLRNRIVVIGSRFYYRFRSLRLNQTEIQFLSMMLSSEDQRISNQTLLNLFDESSLDLGTITRKKNQFVHDLNEKLKFIFRSKSDFLISEKSSSDRRNTYYFIDSSKFLIIKR